MRTSLCVVDDEGITLTDNLLEATHRVVKSEDWMLPDKNPVWELRDLDGEYVRMVKLPI